MIAKFTFNYNGGFEKKENAVFQQGSIGVDSYQVFAPFLTTTQVYIKTKRNGDLEFSLWKQLDYNSTIGGWLKTATQDELLVDGELKVVFKFNNLVSQETSLWVRKGTLIVPEMTTYEALRDYVESVDGRIDQIINGATDIAFDKTGTNLNSDFVEEAIKEVNTKSDANAQNITKIKDGTTIVKKAEQDKNGNDIVNTYETKADATSKKLELDGEILALDGRVEDLETANMIKSYTYNPSTHVLTFTYYDNTTTSFDLPLESAIVDASYDNTTKDITFTLQSGATLVVPLDDLVSGLASETWVTTNFIPKTALKTAFSPTPLDTNVISEKLAKDTFDTKEALSNKAIDFSTVNDTKYPTTKAVDDTYATKTALALKADVAVVNEINREQDHRIATIEEAYRKSQNGELTATKQDIENISLGKDVAPAPLQVKVDGGLLEAKQLVTNGDFSNGTTGWGLRTNTSQNVVNGINTITATTDGESIGIQRSVEWASSIKYYVASRLKSQSTNSIYFWDGGAGLIFTLTANTWTFVSGVRTPTDNLFRIYQSLLSGQTFEVDYAYTFNISTLIANKTYSPLYNKTFDLMLDAEIKAQMDLWVQNGTLPNDNVLSVGMNKRVRSVGKNLFDKSKATFGYYILTSNGQPVASTVKSISDYIKIKPNTTYVFTETDGYALYDINKVYIQGASSNTLTTPSNAYYIRTTVLNINTYQLELGSTATSYVPYANTDLYLQANKVGYKLPNGVADTIEYRNGKYYYVQRVAKYVLQASDISSMFTDGSTYNYAITGDIIPTIKPQVPNTLDYSTYISGMVETTSSETRLNSYYTIDTSKFRIATAVGTTLAQAQTALAGTVIYYQLATPIETEILALGNAQGLAGGTVYIDDVMADSNLYTHRYDIENTAYPIKSLDRIVKINADGSQTELAVSSATIAGDGLSFTHPSLVANDIVWVSYAYNIANLFKSNTFVTYYDNPFIAVQPNGTPRRIVFAVDNSGVVTVSSQAV